MMKLIICLLTVSFLGAVQLNKATKRMHLMDWTKKRKSVQNTVSAQESKISDDVKRHDPEHHVPPEDSPMTIYLKEQFHQTMDDLYAHHQYTHEYYESVAGGALLAFQSNRELLDIAIKRLKELQSDDMQQFKDTLKIPFDDFKQKQATYEEAESAMEHAIKSHDMVMVSSASLKKEFLTEGATEYEHFSKSRAHDLSDTCTEYMETIVKRGLQEDDLDVVLHANFAGCNACQADFTNCNDRVLFGCHRGWVEFNGHCYYATHLQRPQGVAQGVCWSKGSQLISINSADENMQAYRWVRLSRKRWSMGKRYWTGARAANNKWILTDGSPMTYNNFTNEVPAAEDGLCIYGIGDGSAQSGGWYTAQCSLNYYGFICEY